MHGPSLPLALGHSLCLPSASGRPPAQDAAHKGSLSTEPPGVGGTFLSLLVLAPWDVASVAKGVKNDAAQ